VDRHWTILGGGNRGVERSWCAMLEVTSYRHVSSFLRSLGSGGLERRPCAGSEVRTYQQLPPFLCRISRRG